MELDTFVLVCALWLLCVVFGIRNLKRTGHSPLWMLFALSGLPELVGHSPDPLMPLMGFAANGLLGALGVFIASLVVLDKWLTEQEPHRCRFFHFGLDHLNKWLTERAEHQKRLAEQAQQEARREAYLRDAPRRQAEEQRRLEEEGRRLVAQHEAAQRSLALSLTNLVSDSTKTTADLRNLVQAAENTIDLAENEFKGGFFVPFWDAVEQAANQLAQCEASIQRLIYNSTSYNDKARKLDTPPPPLQLILPDASHTANRMRSIVRQSQQEIDFTNVYHQREIIFQQRKTNQLLAAGFTTLGQAINELGDRLDTSSERLASSLSELIAGQERSREQAASAAAAQLEHDRKVGEQAASDAAVQRKQDASADHAQREHERKEREMTDDIRRGRKPFP